MSSSWIRSTVDPRTKWIFNPNDPKWPKMIVWKSLRKKGTVPVSEFPKWITCLIDLSGVCIRIDLITVICSPLTYCPQSELSGPEIPDDSGAWTRLQNCTFSHEIDYFQLVSNRGHFIERLDDPVSSRFREPWHYYFAIFDRKCRYLLIFVSIS